MSFHQLFPSKNQQIIQRPGRYTGLEWNNTSEFDSNRKSILLMYPDLYEIGMSNYGLAVLYQVLHSNKKVNVDRCFSPWPDYENALRRTGNPLRSLSFRIPIRQFDAWFITIPHELCYTNILNLIDLAGLKLKAEERDQPAPIIIGGGIGSLNPEPLSVFFDVFFIGDGEEAAIEIADCLNHHHDGFDRKHSILKALAGLDGFHIPSIQKPSELRNQGRKIVRRVLPDLEEAPFPDPPLVPICKPIHERVVIEIARGCPRQCLFCQARTYYSSVRKRSADTIKKIAEKNLSATGYDELSLLSLNVSDYPGITNLVTELAEEFADTFVSLSLPSLRPESITSELAEKLKQVRKSGFTLAPEAGSDRLRRIIGKPYDETKFLNGIRSIFSAGWKQIKLYFMIGLPFETDEDVIAITRLVQQVDGIGRSMKLGKFNLHVAVSLFVPKPHTAFQWMGQLDDETMNNRIAILRRELRSRSIELSIHDLQQSRLEAVFARADERISKILIAAFNAGCRFDSWKEEFKPDVWMHLFEDAGLILSKEAQKSFHENEILPWDYIHCGNPKLELLRSQKIADEPDPTTPNIETKAVPDAIRITKINPCQPCRPTVVKPFSYSGNHRITGEYRVFGHFETGDAIIRAFRRARLPLEYSYGFNPKPRISFAQPAPFGFEVLCDPVEFRLMEDINPEEVLKAINAQLPSEMHFLSVNRMQSDSPRMSHGSSQAFFGFCSEDFVQEASLSQLLEFQADSEQVSRILNNCLLSFTAVKYNYYLVLPQGDRPKMKLKEVLSCLYGEPSLPFPDASAARFCWISGNPPWIPYLQDNVRWQ